MTKTEHDVFAAGAEFYEAWYDTPEGRRADDLEKGLLSRLLAASFGQPESLLELGCGTGHFTRWFAGQGLSAVGLDRSTAMLAQARSQGGVPLLQADMQHLPFADDAFDVVALITALEFVSDPLLALAEALRVARQGLLLGVLNRHSLLGLQRRLAKPVEGDVYGAAHFYGVGELCRLVRAVAGTEAQLAWRTTLFPRACPWHKAGLPWGGFIGLTVRK